MFSLSTYKVVTNPWTFVKVKVKNLTKDVGLYISNDIIMNLIPFKICAKKTCHKL
jgi:hypothetical protein